MKKVLVLAEKGFNDKELIYPYFRFQEAGYKVEVVGPTAGTTYTGEYGVTIKSDLCPGDVKIDDYIAVVIPGGQAPDRMRRDRGLVNLVREGFKKGKVIGAICHGPQLLIEADVLRGKRATCVMAIATDVKNAGGLYEDRSVVVDGKLVTSRVPDDLPDFCREILKLLQK